MRLTRVYVEAALTPGARVLLGGSAANHIARVLRLRSGDALTVFNGNGGEFAARVEGIQKDTVAVSVAQHRTGDRESPLPLTLAQGISRGERMDWVIQKATELGASRIVPVSTQRSVVRLDEKQAGRKLQHWRAIAVAACEQCGRNRIPDLAAPADFYELLASSGPRPPTSADRAASGQLGPMRILLSPSGDARLDDLEGVGAGIMVLIGPEGGLEDLEHEAALAAGFKAVRVGPRVLRTETAAIAALTIIQHRFGDL
jgi:16S rRNA (uracil1498-N3)-methyltransferase